MRVACLHCSGFLEYSGKRPMSCPYCRHPLPPLLGAPTAVAFMPDANTQAPADASETPPPAPESAEADSDGETVPPRILEGIRRIMS